MAGVGLAFSELLPHHHRSGFPAGERGELYPEPGRFPANMLDSPFRTGEFSPLTSSEVPDAVLIASRGRG